MKKHFLLVLLAACCFSAAFSQSLPYQNARLSAEERARDLLKRLTLEEKARLMESSSPAIKRLGIPQFDWWSEALHGVGRNGLATVFPITIGMAASFDEPLVFDVFTAVSDEARAKNTADRRNNSFRRYQGLSFWTPNINIFRDPRWGRGQETYGEDPFLTTRMGLAVVRGLQGPAGHRYQKLLACAKHFAVHSGPEWNRHSFNLEDVAPRDLWETYLPAFKALVQEGDVKEIMCAYQRIDGEPCCGNNRYLQQILRDEWGFQGLVTSDCWAVNDFWEPGRHGFSPDRESAVAQAVRAGTDVECGESYSSLPEAVKRGQVTEKEIDTSLLRLLKARFELGDFDPDELVEWTSIPMSVVSSTEHRSLALKMARESMVLLQNRNDILPLSRQQNIVVMGPNAADSTMLWGNYNGFPAHTTTILDGIAAKKAANVSFVNACGHTTRTVEESRFGQLFTPDGQRGMTATYWNNQRQEGTPVATAHYTAPVSLSNGGATVFAPGVNLQHFSARLEGILRPQKSEKVVFALTCDDGARLTVDGQVLIDDMRTTDSLRYTRESKCEMQVEAGREYRVVVDYVQSVAYAQLKFNVLNYSTMSDDDILQATAHADVVVFAGGISPRLEGEEMKVDAPGFKGGDRTSIELPEAQRQVIELLGRNHRRVVFVNCSGSAMALVPESQHADAIVQAWYGGEAGGQAVADVLFGDYNPGGKLPLTFYASTDQLPDFEDYSMQNRTYRYFRGEPLFSFGYGLSYTHFTLSNQQVEFVGNAERDVRVTLDVTNDGSRLGDEVVQVYLRRRADVDGPQKALKAFQRVSLQPGETRRVEMILPRQRFENWDESAQTMRVVPGIYDVYVGNSSRRADQKWLAVELKK